MHKAIKEFSSTRGVYNPGDVIKIKNPMVLSHWANLGLIEKADEPIEEAVKKIKPIDEGKPRESEV